MKVVKILVVFMLICVRNSSLAQELITYKEIDSTKLVMEVYSTESKGKAPRPAMLFFFGGGWIGGSRHQFRPHAEYFSKRGIACFLVDYRVKNKHQTSPFESLKDAKSAIRYLRENAQEFNIDQERIIAAGGSAGGHLAAATALIDDYNETSDNLSVNCKPNALVLFNPVIDNGPGGYGYDRIDSAYKQFSPLHNLRKGAPPTIIFLGTEDKLIPVEAAKYYQTVMKKLGQKCELFLYKGAEHGFFNYRNFKYYRKTLSKTDLFLQSIGFLDKEPDVELRKE